MDLSIFYQLRNRQYWWVDAIFYFALSLLLATVLSYLIFVLKTNIAEGEIVNQEVALKTVGTDQQKSQETEVLLYQKKFSDFAKLFKNNQFASTVFSFVQDRAMPYIWYKQFSLDQKNSTVQFFGQTDTQDNLSRQVANFEESPYVEKVTLLNSKLGSDGKIDFNINMILSEKIFSIPDASIIDTTSASKKIPIMMTTSPSLDNGGQ